MLAKFPGSCFYCKRAIKPGTDTYDLDRKVSYHENCKEEDESRIDYSQYDLAERLGYRQYSWDELQRGCLGESREMRDLHPADSSEEPREGSTTH